MRTKTTLGILCILLLTSCTQIQKEELENGIVLITKQVPNTNLIAIHILIHDGQIDETYPGIRNYIQRLLLKGTHKHNRTELALLVDELGKYGGGASADFITLQLKITKDKLDEGLDFLAELLTEATFPEEVIRTFSSV